MVVACLALFVAIGGGAYAAAKINTNDLKREAVTSPKIDKRTIKGNRVANDTLKGKKIRENTLGTVPNADTVDGKHAECGAGTQLFAGACWETAARAAASWPSAAQTCANAGGYLPPAGALRAAALSGFTLAGTDEHSADIDKVTGADAYTVVTVSQAGVINLTNQTDPKGFRCVFPLVH
jgi:hypothetical protein